MTHAAYWHSGVALSEQHPVLDQHSNLDNGQESGGETYSTSILLIYFTCHRQISVPLVDS